MEKLKYRYIDGKIESAEFISETEHYFASECLGIMKKVTTSHVWRDTALEAINDGLDEERIAIKAATARLASLLLEKEFHK